MKKTTLFLVLLVVFSTILIAGCTQQQPTPKEKVVAAVNQTVTNLTDKVDQTIANVTNKTEQTVANLTTRVEQKVVNLTNKT
jgi:PBP1b-binding outer membrane lipoprotein LpoB